MKRSLPRNDGPLFINFLGSKVDLRTELEAVMIREVYNILKYMRVDITGGRDGFRCIPIIWLHKILPQILPDLVNLGIFQYPRPQRNRTDGI